VPPFANDEDDVLDDAAWDHFQRFWRTLVDGLLEAAGQAGEWPSSDSAFHADGVTPMERMYRSICDGCSSRLDRAFSIQQARSKDDKPPYVTAYVSDYVTGLQDFPDMNSAEAAIEWFERVPPDERVPRSSLDVILVYSDAAAAAVSSLLSIWLRPETTPTEMQAAIDATPNVNDS
jgi:hypothetical protein